MLSISAPLKADTVSKYFRTELSVAGSSNYYLETNEVRGEWEGKLASHFNLDGKQVTAEPFDRVAHGHDPNTGERLIAPKVTKDGKEVHRAGHDLTFSAPKSVSVVALAGGDMRVVEAHNAAVKEALAEGETLVQARMSATDSLTTGKWLVATFRHDAARPVDGYSAVQLHTHCIVFNLTEVDGKARAIQSSEIFAASGMLTAVYQNSLERRLRELGYQIERGKNHAPEIAGFSREYLESESHRSADIQAEIDRRGLSGGALARFIAAHSTRSEKLDKTPEEIKAMHLENAARHGNQPQKVVEEALLHPEKQKLVDKSELAARAVTFAVSFCKQTDSVFEQHAVVREALRFARGRIGLVSIKAEIGREKQAGDLIPIYHFRRNAPGARYTTPDIMHDERQCIEMVIDGRGKAKAMGEPRKAWVKGLNPDQLRLVQAIGKNEDRIFGLEGKAGTGKSYALKAVQKMAESSGFEVVGLAPTSKATAELVKAGIEAKTIQKYLLSSQSESGRPRFFVVDESSQVDADQMTGALRLLKKKRLIRSDDRVLFVGDAGYGNTTGQHGSVGAGRIFGELQESGLRTFGLSKIIRQQDPALRAAVEALAHGKIRQGIAMLGDQGRITTIESRRDRHEAIAKDYASSPDGTLVISPDNQSRTELNHAIRRELQKANKIGENIYRAPVLVDRREISGVDRTLAESYDHGNYVFYRCGSKKLGIEDRSYGRVISRNADANTVTVRMESGKKIEYDPMKLRGVSLYQEEGRYLAKGDRVMFTAPSKELGVVNRDAGTITHIEASGNVRVKLDSTGKSVGFNVKSHKHLDYAYASTSHSAQSLTVQRVLVNIDTMDSRIRKLITDIFAYVSVSRAILAARIYNSGSEKDLAQALSRRQMIPTAIGPGEIRNYKKRAMAV